MKRHGVSLLVVVWLLIAAVRASFAAEPIHREWMIERVVREALIYAPANAKTEPVPVVFAFHGHGGTMRQAGRSFGYHTEWPEAIIVYMQGLNTPGQLTDPEGKRPGWQRTVGDQEDRDLKFFDAVLESLKRDYKVDEKRIYSTGHSNGGAFTYLLWAARGDRFAAFAPSAAVGGRQLKLLKPKPVLHVAGEADALVKFDWQKQMIEALRKLNECDEGRPWDQQKLCTVYPSKLNTPVVTYIHHGNHAFPKEAPALIVKFFKEHAQP